MKRFLIYGLIAVLICSGVIGVSVKVKVGSFSEAKDKVVEWYDEVLYPIFERGIIKEGE